MAASTGKRGKRRRRTPLLVLALLPVLLLFGRGLWFGSGGGDVEPAAGEGGGAEGEQEVRLDGSGGMTAEPTGQGVQADGDGRSGPGTPTPGVSAPGVPAAGVAAPGVAAAGVAAEDGPPASADVQGGADGPSGGVTASVDEALGRLAGAEGLLAAGRLTEVAAVLETTRGIDAVAQRRGELRRALRERVGAFRDAVQQGVGRGEVSAVAGLVRTAGGLESPWLRPKLKDWADGFGWPDPTKVFGVGITQTTPSQWPGLAVRLPGDPPARGEVVGITADEQQLVVRVDGPGGTRFPKWSRGDVVIPEPPAWCCARQAQWHKSAGRDLEAWLWAAAMLEARRR